MWSLSLPWWEFVLRAAIVYFFLLISLRLSGKRQIGEFSPFDLVLLLILSNAVQNSMNGGDNSVLAGLILSGSLILMNHLMGYLTFRSKKVESLVEGTPKVLIHNGKINEGVRISERMTDREIEEVLRNQGILKISDVRYAIIEINGKISVIKKEK